MRSAVTAMALTSFAASATPNAPPVQGQWWTPGFNAPVRIETCGDNAARGGVVWLRGGKPQGIADKTPLVGQLVIDRMKRAKPDACADGRLDNPDEGRDHKGSLQLRSDEILVVDGGVPFVRQAQVRRCAAGARCITWA